jgi:hypothetical protein
MNGPMPPSVNGPMMPPPLSGPMPPQPALNNGEGGRFGGDMQSLGASLGGLSVTQSGNPSPL